MAETMNLCFTTQINVFEPNDEFSSYIGAKCSSSKLLLVTVVASLSADHEKQNLVGPTQIPHDTCNSCLTAARSAKSVFATKNIRCLFRLTACQPVTSVIWLLVNSNGPACQ